MSLVVVGCGGGGICWMVVVESMVAKGGRRWWSWVTVVAMAVGGRC